jgi:predicted phage tail protein|tara:strand:+ start:1518 stop:2165 length:648 start_codon:yes stop_codon:yes gene_type:complete
MKVVKVYGALRKLLGQCRFELDVVTPGQAIKALCVNFPQLEKWLLDSEKDGVAYRVTVGKQKATEQDVSPLLLPFGDREVFSITPVIAGAGRGGTGQVLFGIALIATAIVFAPAAGGFLGIGGSGAITGATGITLGAAASSAIGTVGLSLLIGGVAQMLSPPPQPQSYEEAKQLESFSFSGIVNTSRQGVPVPIVLGRAYAGSVVISSGLDVVQD